MEKNKIIALLKGRIASTQAEYDRQNDLYNKDKRYGKPDWCWCDTRIKAFNEALELIGMLDNKHNV